MLYLHGGSFVTWQPQDLPYRSLGTRLARACGVCVLSIDYRNAPEHLFPAAFDDCAAALESGPRRTAPGARRPSPRPGTSSCAATARAARWRSASASTRLRRCAACCGGSSASLGGGDGYIPASPLSAWTDMTASLPSYDTRLWDPEKCFGDATNAHCQCRQDGRDEAEGYLGRGGVERHGRDWRASPFFVPSARLRAMPAVLLHVGDYELLLDDSVQLHRKLVQAGHRDATCSVYPRMWHVWHQYSEGGGEHRPLQKALRAVREIGQWVTARKS
ncbi:unnamed protein product [Prorocentrum cordatum]|uniref:Alpha/beta hydrolase fold-3 domain-containing protein n=1 Tax=Prorocentrum cordatum TaxID=2364126 RepID=A0ABN9VFC0_9DINO|nr:unnamed protein product [Polarella glacialis]